MTEMSSSERDTVARFENAQPAPESWGGDDGLREAHDLLLAALCPSMPPCQDHRDDACEAAPFLLAWAERRARERAAEELLYAAQVVRIEHGTASTAAKIIDGRADTLTDADDRTGQR